MYFIGKRFSGSTDTCQRCVNCHWLGSDSWRKGMCVLLIDAMFFLSDFRAAYVYRVSTGPGKPGKSWNHIMAFSKTGKTWKKATGPEKFWKSVKPS